MDGHRKKKNPCCKELTFTFSKAWKCLTSRRLSEKFIKVKASEQKRIKKKKEKGCLKRPQRASSTLSSRISISGISPWPVTRNPRPLESIPKARLISRIFPHDWSPCLSSVYSRKQAVEHNTGCYRSITVILYRWVSLMAQLTPFRS